MKEQARWTSATSRSCEWSLRLARLWPMLIFQVYYQAVDFYALVKHSNVQKCRELQQFTLRYLETETHLSTLQVLFLLYPYSEEYEFVICTKQWIYCFRRSMYSFVRRVSVISAYFSAIVQTIRIILFTKFYVSHSGTFSPASSFRYYIKF